MPTIDKKYLAKLLVHGISQTQAASALGCTQGYISQLVESDQELAKEIGEIEAQVAAIRIKKDEKLEHIEKALITRTAELVGDTDSLSEAVGALQKVTDLRERQSVRPSGGNAPSQILELNLGKLAEAQLSVTMGENRVIMNIGGKDMTRAPSSVVKRMVEEIEDDAGKDSNPVYEFPASATG